MVKMKWRMPLYMAGRVATAIATGSTAATTMSRSVARRRAGTSLRAAAIAASTMPARSALKKISGICRANSVGT